MSRQALRQEGIAITPDVGRAYVRKHVSEEVRRGT